MWETVRKTLISTFHDFAVVKQRVAATFQPHQSSKHLPIHNKLCVATSQTMSDPGSLWSYIDHVIEEVEPADGTDLISVVEKWTRAAVFPPRFGLTCETGFLQALLCPQETFPDTRIGVCGPDCYISPLRHTSGSSCAWTDGLERKDGLHVMFLMGGKNGNKKRSPEVI